MMKTHDHLYNHVRLCEIPLFHKILPATLRNAINTLTRTEAVSLIALRDRFQLEGQEG